MDNIMTQNNFNPKLEYELVWESNNLKLTQENRQIPVKPVSNFPWSDPEVFISLCDGEGSELILLSNLEILTEKSREALRSALNEVRFVLEIKSIRKVKDEAELRIWDVETQLGERKFLTKLDEWPQALSENRVLITDVAGDLYEVKDLFKLDQKSQALLWPLVDWE